MDETASLIRRTFRDPQSVALALIGANLTYEARWTAVALVGVLSVIGLKLALWIMPAGEPTVFSILADPWLGLPLQILSIVLLASVMVIAGRLQGGQGRFADALVLVSWIEFVMAMAQAVQIVTMVILPPLSILISVASLVLFAWLMVHFTAALHRLASLGRVLLALLGGFVALIVLAAMVLGVLGVVPNATGV